MGIKKVFADQDGTRLVFIDDHNQGYVYTPVSSLFMLKSKLRFHLLKKFLFLYSPTTMCC